MTEVSKEKPQTNSSVRASQPSSRKSVERLHQITPDEQLHNLTCTLPPKLASEITS